MSCPRLFKARATRIALHAILPRTSRTCAAANRRLMSSASASGLRSLLKVSEEVADAVAADKPVVALESTIYTHGAMGRHLAAEHEQLVRSHGGIPAIIAIVDGVPTVGVSSDDVVRMIDSQSAAKVSRRDMSYLVGMGIAGRKLHGGTTISGTMLLARLAGIRVFGTGGLGGVHRNGENTMDVSADLTELGRTRVAVISSGCKGFLDIPRTLEFLETQGCLVSTFADGRAGKVDFPGFWARNSGSPSPSVVYNEREAAAMILSQERLGIESGMLFANPIPEEYGIPLPEIQSAIEQAVREADENGASGKDNTPYILGRLKELTGDKAVVANMALVRQNLIRATNVSVELSRLLQHDVNSYISISPPTPSPPPTIAPVQAGTETTQAVSHRTTADIMVAGSVAVDLSCDYASADKTRVSPQPSTSNPATISQSIGGVGYNVALAAHRASGSGKVKFCSLIGDDVAGSTVLSAIEAEGLDTAYVRQLGAEHGPANRTAQYVAVNDGEKNLVMAMADMDIFSHHSFQDDWLKAVAEVKPKWLVVDGNWGQEDIKALAAAGKGQGSKVAFEPVSAEKSARLFGPLGRGEASPGVFPNAAVDLASPNTHELAQMYTAARANGYLDTPEWFGVIDSFGMRGARERFVYMTTAELTDAGIPVQSIQLLPYIPTIITKLGSNGALLTTLLAKDDARLSAADSQQFILARAVDHPTIGGVYMRLYPAVEEVKDVVSVNGAGDTFLGVMISGLAQGGSVERLVNVAQQGAVMSLRSAESVSPEVASLQGRITKAILMSDDESASESDFSGLDYSNERQDEKGAAKAGLSSKDSEEEELERMVLGNSTGFRQSLFKGNDWLMDGTEEVDGQVGDDAGELEDVQDKDLFIFDAGTAGVGGKKTEGGKATTTAGAGGEDQPAWEDSDDERLAISLAGATRLRKLRVTEAEDVVSGTEYSRRLRQQYVRLNPSPAWAKGGSSGGVRSSKRRRKSGALSDGDDDDDDDDKRNSSSDSDDGSDVEAQPLQAFLRDVNKLSGRGQGQQQKYRRLRPEIIDIQRTREIPDRHRAPVDSLSFHPKYPVLLSSSPASVLYLHHIAPEAHPTANPQLTSVQVKHVDVRRSEFLYPEGDKIFFAGRRRYFHHWDLPSGSVQKTSQIQGLSTKAEHKSMERFRLSPCGRHMAIAATPRKGGGSVSILSTATMQWVASARMASHNGIADFRWWSTGDGLTILGRDGQVGEYSVESRRFLGIWLDEGCVGAIALGLGGHQGPSALGDDRWVAVGSSSGITNIYDRQDVLLPRGRSDEDGGGDGPVDVADVAIRERPKPTRTFEQIVTPITTLSFSPDGQLMAFASQHSKDALRLVHLPSCTVYRNWPTEQTPLGRVTSVAFSRQSDLLAVGSDSGKIRMWQIRS
ncbi:pseudouridylate synthase / pseudouridine kinase [Geosmithia morbida]|uniref:Pseudouridylate synthase / pseudouridine kinase n=1 Tax=Geosmithia morbida TaxID=1094350 RepID=A0A9P4YYH2_9HYPO|nr:pseudouridylate synthase / pseudouridine kinase [Geosmithia morbida]KAF4124003.1 pseudouridylate synthase / pseudouridine kinase [Geosmithia morbida]